MEKTTDKAKTISEVIADLQKWKDDLGDVEVFVANADEGCFDGIGNMFAIQTVKNNETFLGIIRSHVVIKP